MTRIILVCFMFYFISTAIAKTFSKCELVYELRRQGFPEYQMKDLVCLVEAESSFQTNIKGGPNTDGSYDWGLFQINDRYWCNAANWPGKGCDVRCSDLLLDDITQASSCAKKILAYQGLDAWYGWVNHCKGRWLPDLNC
ncbi:lysozyme-like [Anticarsia gemmatalis]|uniref:lysozyme-like n=1 Tax=Anticarsia gemmatalis TaxID=129554 RepID=UPI003F7615B9